MTVRSQSGTPYGGTVALNNWQPGKLSETSKLLD